MVQGSATLEIVSFTFKIPGAKSVPLLASASTFLFSSLSTWYNL